MGMSRSVQPVQGGVLNAGSVESVVSALAGTRFQRPVIRARYHRGVQPVTRTNVRVKCG
jgi:hypothetical protein